jgi:hypothetical protein
LTSSKIYSMVSDVDVFQKELLPPLILHFDWFSYKKEYNL